MHLVNVTEKTAFNMNPELDSTATFPKKKKRVRSYDAVFKLQIQRLNANHVKIEQKQHLKG